MKAGYGVAVLDFELSTTKIAEAAQHVVGATSDDGGQTAGNAGLENGVEGASQVGQRDNGIIKIDAHEAVDLDVNKAGGQVDGVGGTGRDLVNVRNRT